MFIPSNGLDNHPIYTGHLVSGSAMLAEDLGANLNADTMDLFLRKDRDPRKPDKDISKIHQRNY